MRLIELLKQMWPIYVFFGILMLIGILAISYTEYQVRECKDLPKEECIQQECRFKTWSSETNQKDLVTCKILQDID